MNPYLHLTYDFAPRVAKRLIERIPESRWDEQPGPDRFTVREAISHLADWEPIWVERFQKGLAEPGGRITVYDEGQLAIERNYAARNPLAEADRYIEGRAKLAELVRGLSADQLAITIDHPERGLLTLDQMAGMIQGHDVYHLDHFSLFL